MGGMRSWSEFLRFTVLYGLSVVTEAQAHLALFVLSIPRDTDDVSRPSLRLSLQRTKSLSSSFSSLQWIYSISVSQCDQMTAFTLLIFCPSTTMKNCPIVYKIHWSQSEFLPNTKQILIKLPKNILVYAKVAKFHQIWSHWILSPPPLPLPFSMFVSLSKSFSHKFPFSSHTQSRVLDSQSTFIAF